MDLNLLPVLLWYLVGHAVVLVLAFVSLRFLRREPALANRRDAIFELNSKPARIEAGQAELVASTGEVHKLERDIQQVQDKIDTYVQLDDPPSTTLAYFLLALILAEGEAAVLLLLSGPSQFLGLSLQLWAFAAVPAAFVGVTALHVLLGTMLADKHRPARTVRRAKVGAVVCGVAVLLGAWMTLSGRNLTDADLIAQLAGVGLMTLSILLSLTAAFCSIIASTVFEAQSHERKLARFEQRHDAYQRHIELVQKDLTRLQTPTDPTAAAAPTATPTPASTSASHATAAAPAGLVPTIMALALLVLPALSYAQSTPPPVSTTVTTTINTTVHTEAPRASVPAFARGDACEVLVDITTSVDRVPFQTTVTQVSAMLPLVADAFHCGLVRIVPFAGDLFVSITEVPIPSLTDAEGLCRTAAAPTTAMQRAVRQLYPGLVPAQQDRALKTCLAQQQPATDKARDARRDALAQAADRVRAVGALDPRGPCTALPQAIQRAVLRSQHVLVVSDGVATCTPPVTATHVPQDGHLFFLLVPSGEQLSFDRANLLLDRMAALQQLFPNAQIMLAPEATPSFWQRAGHPK